MRLDQVILNNFRAYRIETRFDIDDLTALIGKNDTGKSTVLEALEIFFNSDQITIEPADACVKGENKQATIGCVFSNFPDLLTIDVQAKTKLREELLLNKDGKLEIRKRWDLSKQKPKEEVFAFALHPSNQKAKDLLRLKISDLKQRAKELNVPDKSYDS